MSVWTVENSSLLLLQVENKTTRKEIGLTWFLMLGRRIKERKVMMRLTDVQKSL